MHLPTKQAKIMAPIYTLEYKVLTYIFTYCLIALYASTLFICDHGYASSNVYSSTDDDDKSFPRQRESNLDITSRPTKSSFRTTTAQSNAIDSPAEKDLDRIKGSYLLSPGDISIESKEVSDTEVSTIAQGDLNRVINIGIVGNLNNDSIKLRTTLANINRTLASVNATLNTITISMKSNPLEMSQEVCHNLIESRVSAVIVENLRPSTIRTVSTISISFTCGLYNIPIIGTDDRDSSLSNKNIHPSFLRVIPPFTHQADVWMDLIVKFTFNRVVVITTSDDQSILSRLSDLIDQRPEDDVRIETLIEYESLQATPEDVYEAQVEQTRNYLVNRLTDILTYSICRVFLIHATNSGDISLIFEVLHRMKMDQDGFVLILSEAALVTATEPNHKLDLKIPPGSISARLKYYDPVDYKIDALNLITRSIQLMASKKLLTDPPNSCGIRPMADWATGLALYHSITRQRYHGYSGYIAFNELGDRVVTSYDILNIIESDDKNEQLNVVGTYSNNPHQNESSNILINMDRIIWPGGVKEKPSGIFIKKHLKIVTLQERPFVWIHKGNCQTLTTNDQVVSSNMKLQRETRSDSDEVYNKDTNISAKTISINKNTFSTQNQNHFLDTSSEIRHASISCKKYNQRYNRNEEYCCEGYCMDLLDELSKRVNFTYEVYIVEDNQYGTIQNSEIYPTTLDEDTGLNSQTNSFEARTSSHQQQQSQNLGTSAIGEQEYQSSTYNYHDNNGNMPTWNGLIGELVSKRADMAFAPLSVTPGRAQVIDFSKPFKFHGFSILLRRASMHTTLASFLQPFHNQLWVLVIGVATHVVALSLYLLDRYSTFGRFGMKRNIISSTLHNKHDEHPLHFSSSLWFSWSILLNSGVGEHTPKSLSGRVLGMFWSGFAMIVVASYTANLAAFLVLDSREEQITISGIDDPRLRSGDSAFSFATVRGSAVDIYLQSQVEYINLYRKMEEFNFDNVDDAVDALRNGTIDALIWDSTRLEWETSHDEKCSLGITGELFGRSGYGIGLQKNSYWTKNVTTKLLELHESGFMMDLDRKWISTGASSCDRKNDEYPETLGISNIAGVFILFACGLVTSFGLIVVERAYVNYRKKSKVRSRARSYQ